MNNLFACGEMLILPGGMESGVSDQPITLNMASGVAWVTVEGSNNDYWLTAGESIVIQPGKRVIVGAEERDGPVKLRWRRAPAHSGALRAGLKKLSSLFR